jgi:hypothetical protein
MTEGVVSSESDRQSSHGVRLLPLADEAPEDDKGVLDNLASYRYALRYNQLLPEFLRSQ